MTKKLRKEVFNKYNGLCAYTGKPLGEDWQVDHVTSKIKHQWHVFHTCKDLTRVQEELKKVDCVENLLPAIRIINHYKRSLDLEGFRHYMSYFHKRLSKLPNVTKVERTIKRKKYMMEVAGLFEITIDKPFCGRFYFETINALL